MFLPVIMYEFIASQTFAYLYIIFLSLKSKEEKEQQKITLNHDIRYQSLFQFCFS